MTDNSLFEWAVKCMNSAAFVYLTACFFYIFAVASSKRETSNRWSRCGSVAVLVGFALHTSAMLMRWYIGGISRPPWTNLYESLVFFAWGVALFQIYAQFKWKIRLAGLVGMPLVFILMGMSVMTPNKGVEPLIPALQSYWLKIHVVFGMLSYAGFTTAGCFAFLHLMRNGVSLSKIAGGLATLAVLNLAISGGRGAYTHGRFEMAKTATVVNSEGKQVQTKDVYREFENGPVITRMETVPYASGFYFASLLCFGAAGLLFFFGRRQPTGATAVRSKSISVDEAARQGHDIARVPYALFVTGLVTMVGLFAAVGWGLKNSSTLTLHSNPYLTLLLLMTFFFSLAFVFITRHYRSFLSVLPTAERLDELSYVNILFAFPFQTLLLITGAIWAFYAWGRSWGWDPKETWALITWLAFLIYLHGKLLMRWKPNFLSIVAIFGFVILVFAFLGVNLVLSGLHSYGAA